MPNDTATTGLSGLLAGDVIATIPQGGGNRYVTIQSVGFQPSAKNYLFLRQHLLGNWAQVIGY